MIYHKFGRIFKGRYVKDVNKDHFMIKFNGFGVSEGVLQELKQMNINQILTIYNKVDGTKEYYLTSLNRYLESNLTHTFNETDLQKFVPLKDMVKVNPEVLR